MKPGDLIKDIREGETLNIYLKNGMNVFGNLKEKGECDFLIKLPFSGQYHNIPYDEVDHFTWEAASIHTSSTIRDEILEKAKSIINGERQGTYGAAEDSFAVIAQLWSAYLGKEINSADVANLMILMKVARNHSGVYKDDNWIDIAGYAALGGEIQASYKNE